MTISRSIRVAADVIMSSYFMHAHFTIRQLRTGKAGGGLHPIGLQALYLTNSRAKKELRVRDRDTSGLIDGGGGIFRF